MRNSTFEERRCCGLCGIARLDRFAAADYFVFELADARFQFGCGEFGEILTKDDGRALLLGRQFFGVDRHIRLRSRHMFC